MRDSALDCAAISCNLCPSHHCNALLYFIVSCTPVFCVFMVTKGSTVWLQLLNLTWGAMASVAAGILLEKLKIESKPIQVQISHTMKLKCCMNITVAAIIDHVQSCIQHCSSL